jgi:hypothetical protein
LDRSGDYCTTRGACVESAGNADFYGCSGGDGFTKPMHVARVPLRGALDRSQWRFHAGNRI